MAHFQHTYWQAMRPELFPHETSAAEQETYGGAIEHGYRIADELLQRVLKLLERDTILVVASSMGQKPYLTNLKTGRRIRQIRSYDRLLELLGVQEQAHALATMSDQFNIYANTADLRDFVARTLAGAYVDTPDHPMFGLDVVENSVTASLKSHDGITEDSRCYFPHLGPGESLRYGDLVYDSGKIKSGCHDPKGMMILYGPGIKAGAEIRECNNLDVMPTLMALLALPIPADLKGRVLAEAFDDGRPQVQAQKLLAHSR